MLGTLYMQCTCKVKCWSADKRSVHVKSPQNVDAVEDETQLSTVSQPAVQSVIR